MRKVGLMVCICLLAISADAFAKRPKAHASEIKRDTVVGFVDSRELRVVNPAPIEIGYRKWAYGSVCTAQDGAAMQVLGTGGGKVLLLYIPPADESTIACPPGVMFLLSTRDFLRLKAVADKKRAAEEAEKALVQQILSER